MGWFSEDELSNTQLVVYFVSCNIWRFLVGGCVLLALYCYSSCEASAKGSECQKKVTVDAVRKPSELVAAMTDTDELPQQHQHGVKMVFNGPVHVVMPATLGKIFDDWGFDHQDCRSDLF